MNSLIELIPRPALLMLASVCMLSSCAVGPTYQTPTSAQSATYKEAGDWLPAAPADALERGPWWTLFNDPVLNGLTPQVAISNQNIAQSRAAYAQARALVREQRAALFPVIDLNGGADKTGGGNANTSGRASANRASTNYQVTLGASWEPDVWGRLGRAVDGANANAQASAADLASATLSAQGELASNYFSLRQTDAQQALLRSTIDGYQRILKITQNRYAAGIAPKADLLQAQTQLANAQADDLTLTRQRAQFEHAIAVLLGKAPAEFTLTPQLLAIATPAIPISVPSTLLQRRPDIAAAERRVAAANEQIGIAQAAFYPNIGLNASYGFGASRVAELFSIASSAWSLGSSAAQTLFNAGLTSARVDAARAAHEQATASYRQTVLTAFQQVEDQLAATRVLAQQQTLREQAAEAAAQAEAQLLNRYNAGQVNYTDVVTAQVSSLNAKRALVQLQADRLTTAVALIQGLGGGWQAR